MRPRAAGRDDGLAAGAGRPPAGVSNAALALAAIIALLFPPACRPHSAVLVVAATTLGSPGWRAARSAARPATCWASMQQIGESACFCRAGGRADGDERTASRSPAGGGASRAGDGIERRIYGQEPTRRRLRRSPPCRHAAQLLTGRRGLDHQPAAAHAIRPAAAIAAPARSPCRQALVEPDFAEQHFGEWQG